MRGLLVGSALCLSVACSVPAGALTSLTGDWTVSYATWGQCLAAPENAHVVQDGLAWRIHKTTARHACVPTKVVAAWGKLGDATGARCFLTTGTLDAPASAMRTCRYVRIDENRFRIDTDTLPALTFTRTIP